MPGRDGAVPFLQEQARAAYWQNRALTAESQTLAQAPKPQIIQTANQ